MESSRDRLVRRNDESRAHWHSFAAHRAQVTSLLTAALTRVAATTVSSRLAVLGAGNANDLQLAALTRLATELHLVDLDGRALASARESQPDTAWDRITLHGDIDVTGMMEKLEAITPRAAQGSLSQDEIERLAANALAAPRPNLPGAYRVTASVALLSQLIDAIVTVFGGWRDECLPLVQAIRTRHLRLLAELTEPGGAVVLVADIVSSATYPGLAKVSLAELPALLGQLIGQRNFFTGMNPVVLQQFFSTDPIVAPRVANLQVTRPWLWDFGPRTYAVFGIVAQLKTQ